MAENLPKLINNSKDLRRMNAERSTGRALQTLQHRQGGRERAKARADGSLKEAGASVD